MSRTTFLKTLRQVGAPTVSPTQLLRWTHSQWIHWPTVRGKGRGQGIEAVYSGEMFWDCYFLARFLKQPRATLATAGWSVWVVGLGRPDTVRAFLLEELRARLAAARIIAKPGRHARTVERALGRVSAQWPAVEMTGLIGATGSVRVLRAIAHYEAGIPLPLESQLEPQGWDDARDGMVDAIWDRVRTILPALNLPEDKDDAIRSDPATVPQLLAAELPLQPLITIIERWPDEWLRGMAFEAQFLLEEFTSRRWVITPDVFLKHVRSQLHPERRAALTTLRTARGWTTPPAAPVMRWPEFAPFLQARPIQSGGVDATAS
ncbi:MAG: hypothetical protein ACHQ9S_26985 [Candidatus Binatia bacterium]